MDPISVPDTIISRLRALFGHDKLPRYRVIDRATGQTLQKTDHYAARYRAVESLIEQGWTWETLDLIDADGKSQMHSEALPSYGSLAIAHSVANAIVVADSPGNDPFFTCPAAMITCPERQLDRLADELHGVCVGWNPDFPSPMLWFLPLDFGDQWGVTGGFVQDRLWVSDEIGQFGWADAVWEVLSGARENLPSPLDGKGLRILWMIPERIRYETRGRLRLILEASTVMECEARRGELAVWLRRRGQDRAAEILTSETT